MGIYAERELQRQGALSGVALTGEYVGQMVGVVATLPSHVWDATQAALGIKERSREGIIGVVGIGRIAAESAGADIEGYGFLEKVADQLLLLAGLNLALFVFNMIPLVPLDGGHVASALWQATKNGWARVRGAATPRPVDVARMMPLAYGVFGVLLLMGAVLIVADIVAPVTAV
jgi:Zn-dependent protease